MRIEKFEDVISWQKGKDLYLEINKVFGHEKNFSFKDQLFRATLSITNNIAEGFDRGSDRELRQFLIISRGSCAEVRSMLHMAKNSNKIGDKEYQELLLLTNDISKLLTGFIRKLVTENRRQET